MRPEVRQVIAQNPTYPLMEKLVADPQALLNHMDQEGIWQLWMINYCARDVMGYGNEVNTWAANYVQADPERLKSTGGYDPRHDGNGRTAIDTIREQGLIGVKFHPVHQRLSPAAHRGTDKVAQELGRAYARLEEHGMVAIFHSGTSIFPGADNDQQHVVPMAAVAQDHPDLPIIIAHGGRPHETTEAVELVRKHPRIHIDLSSLPPKRIPEWFPDLPELADRFLWGSDWPGPRVPGMAANVQSFLELGYDNEVNQRLLHDNAVRILQGGSPS